MRNQKITIHGFEDWIPTKRQWNEILNTAQIGANQDCDATIDGIRKTIKEWKKIEENKKLTKFKSPGYFRAFNWLFRMTGRRFNESVKLIKEGKIRLDGVTATMRSSHNKPTVIEILK